MKAEAVATILTTLAERVWILTVRCHKSPARDSIAMNLPRRSYSAEWTGCLEGKSGLLVKYSIWQSFGSVCSHLSSPHRINKGRHPLSHIAASPFRRQMKKEALGLLTNME